MEFRFTQVRLIFSLSLTFALVACGTESANEPAETTAVPEIGATRDDTPRQRVLFFGDSITAGYGLDPQKAFPSLIQKRIDDRNWEFEVVNAGVSGETSAGGLRRIDWVLRSPVDVLVLELGANDGLRGLPVGGMKSNLMQIIQKTREKNPDVSVVVAGMRMPPNLGSRYAAAFDAVFPAVAEEANAVLLPFILQDVAGKRSLNQLDGIHPTAKGQEIVAETVWQYLEPVLEERLEQKTDQS